MRAALIAAVLVGCTSTGGGDDERCAVVEISLRDPSSGLCEPFDEGACRGIPDPDWASCSGACDALDEPTCLATAGCRAVYTGHVCQPHECTTAPDLTYVGCWGTSPEQHLAGTSCWSLNPYNCSSDQDCAALFQPSPATPPFLWETCMPQPEALAAGTCDAGATCRALPPACPTGTQPGEDGTCYTGYCIPTADCAGPIDPGTCSGAACQIAPPACPSGTEPGVTDVCWSGYCVPISACTAQVR